MLTVAAWLLTSDLEGLHEGVAEVGRVARLGREGLWVLGIFGGQLLADTAGSVALVNNQKCFSRSKNN